MTRRAFGGMVVTAGVLTGCASRPAASPSSAKHALAQQADLRLVESARQLEDELVALLTAALDRQRELGHELRAARQVHRAHSALLSTAADGAGAGDEGKGDEGKGDEGKGDGDEGDEARPGARTTTPARPRPSLAALVRAEQSLQHAHAEAAAAADSGPLARLLAGMAAAAAQQALVLQAAQPAPSAAGGTDG